MVPLIRLASVDSTQAFLRRHPELHPCGVLADMQTEGRGRQGNRWESAPGSGLWLSASIHLPEVSPGIVLQRAMGAVMAALDQCGVPLGLKWPNDLVAHHHGQLVKVGGILGERVGARLILGVGVNVRSAPDLPDRAMPAACLADLGAKAVTIPELAAQILRFWSDLTRDVQPAFRWPSEGDAFRWEGGQGVCLGWESDGRLKVTTAEGIQRLSAGEVRGLR
jgi:BirA family biotin operon repressor/biotin-[acetyl-CoA-carboxylase] ligase